MIFTARQLEDLQKAHGQVALPRGARLTPLAQDWLRSRKIGVVYTDLSSGGERPASEGAGLAKGGERFLWWCDGPCGMAKAALSAYREVNLSALSIAADGGRTLGAVKEMISDLKSQKAHGGLMFVQASAVAMVALNRDPAVRSVLGTSLQTVDQAMRQVAANVLVIEYGSQTLQQMKNLIGRFVKGKREMSPEMEAAIKGVAS